MLQKSATGRANPFTSDPIVEPKNPESEEDRTKREAGWKFYIVVKETDQNCATIVSSNKRMRYRCIERTYIAQRKDLLC